MAIRYVRNSATGANNGTSWDNAYTTFASATYFASAGDTIYISTDHVGPWASINKGTFASPLNVIAADPTNNPPTSLPAPGSYATLSSGGELVITGCVYFHGIHLLAGNRFWFGGQAAMEGTTNLHFENCKFTTAGYIAFNQSQPGSFSYSSLIRFTNCELYANANGYNTYLYSTGGGTFIWRGGSHTRNPSIATNPTSICSSPGFYDLRKWEINGVDFSVANWSSPPVLGMTSMEFGKSSVTNCKLQSGQRTNGASHWSNGRTSIVNTLHTQFTSSGGASYSTRTFSDAFYHGLYLTAFTESRVKTTPVNTLSIVQPSSQRFSYVSDSASSALFTYVHASLDAPIWFWNETVGVPITIKLNMFIRAGTLTTDSRRIEVQYPADASSPRVAIARSGNDVTSHTNNGPPFGSAGTYTGATSTWVPTFATEGGWPPHFQYDLSVTITPQAKGFIRISYAKFGLLSEHQSGSTNFNTRPLIS